MTTELQIKGIGTDRSIAVVRELSEIVRQNWAVIFLGAARLGLAIPSDNYADKRVQIDATRLHQTTGVKYANGWRYTSIVGPDDEDIRETVKCIQMLIDEGAKEVGTHLTIHVF